MYRFDLPEPPDNNRRVHRIWVDFITRGESGWAPYDAGARILAMADMLARLRRALLKARLSVIRPGQNPSDQIDLDDWTCDSTAA